MERGVEIEKALALNQWQENSLFSEEERLVLEYTEAVTNSKGEIAKEIKQKMTARYAQRELVKITTLIAYQNMSTKFNNAFGVEPQGFCSIETNQ